jgi:hypothetical protein
MKTMIALAALAVVAAPVHAQQRAPATGGTQGHGMTGMSNMQSMMDNCARMRRQMAQGKMSSAPDMNRMMAQCDQMDQQMGNMPGMGAAQAPAGTRDR